MPDLTDLRELLIEPFQAGDLLECVSRVRPWVDAHPQETVPRLILAQLFLRLDNQRAAQLQYERLLPLCVGRGQVLAAVAVQSRLDALPGARPNPGRYAAIQRWFRMSGTSVTSPGLGASQDFGPSLMLALPRTNFEELAMGAVPVFAGVEGSREATGGTLWMVLYGEVLWRWTRADGTWVGPNRAIAGQQIRLDPQLVRSAQVELTSEVPSECLRIDAERMLEVARRSPLLARALSISPTSLTREERSLLPSHPPRFEDLDLPSETPTTPKGDAPPRLATGLEVASGPRDDGSWLELHSLELPDVIAAGEASGEEGRDLDLDGATPPLSKEHADHLPNERMLSPDDLQATPKREAARKPPRPVVEAAAPVEMNDGLVVPPVRDPFAAPAAPLGTPIERRQGVRVAASYVARFALMGFAGAHSAPACGSIVDLSTSGFRMQFDREEFSFPTEVLQDAAVGLELCLPDRDDPLKLAGRVRWVELDEKLERAHLGVAFVLLTCTDVKDLERALAHAAQESATAPRGEAPKPLDAGSEAA